MNTQEYIKLKQFPMVRVKDVVEEIFDTEYIGGYQPNLNPEKVTQILNRFKKSIRQEVIAELESRGKISSGKVIKD